MAPPEQRARVDYIIALAYAQHGNLEGALEYLARAKTEHSANEQGVPGAGIRALVEDPGLHKIVSR